MTSLAALVMGLITLLSLLVSLGLSPWVPVSLCFLGLGLTLMDSLMTKGRYSQLLSDVLQEYLSPQQRQRLAYHESGHLLVGYSLGLRPVAYAVGAWRSYQAGYSASSLVEFDQPQIFGPRAYGITLMAGGVAEVLQFGEAEGGKDDLEQLTHLLNLNPQKKLLEREYCREATRILQEHGDLHTQLAQKMLAAAPLEDCLILLLEWFPESRQSNKP